METRCRTRFTCFTGTNTHTLTLVAAAGTRRTRASATSKTVALARTAVGATSGLKLLCMCPHAAICVCSDCYIYVRMHLYVCPHAAIYVSACCYICVRMLFYVCPHAAIRVSACCCRSSVLMLTAVGAALLLQPRVCGRSRRPRTWRRRLRLLQHIYGNGVPV